MEKSLESLAFCPHSPAEIKIENEGGEGAPKELVAVATSKLTGKEWNGLILFLQIETQVLEEKTKLDTKISSPHVAFFTQTEVGNTDLEWLNPEQVVVANDLGQLQVWQFGDSPKVQLEAVFYEHDDIIESLNVNRLDRRNILTASWDKTIKLWDVYNETGFDGSTFTYKGHKDHVYSVRWQPGSLTNFASASKDSTIKLWDSRTNITSLTINSNFADNYFTSLSWSNKNEHLLAAGTVNGSVLFVDTRNPSTFFSTFSGQLHHPIFSLEFSPNHSKHDRLAVGSDDSKVVVIDPTTNKVLLSENHNDFVRDVCWDPKGEFVAACSWDSFVSLSIIS